MASHSVTKSAATPEGRIEGTVTKTGDMSLRYTGTIGIGVTDQQIDIAFDKDNYTSIFITSDQDLTLETNSSSAPSQTISLLADIPFEWQRGGYHTNPITTDVTVMFVTNASGVAAALDIAILTDATP